MDITSLQQAAANELANGQLEKSHNLCLRILELQPKNAEAHFLLAINSLSRKQAGKAIVLLQVATRLKPVEGRYWVQLARAYSQTEKIKDCQQALEKALQCAPKDVMSIDTLGVLLSRLGDHVRAETYFKHSLERQSNNPDYLFNLASCLRINGKLDEALTHYLTLFQVHPERYDIYPVLAELTTNAQCSTLQAQFEQTLEAIQSNTNGQLQVSHGLARLQERQGQYSEALEVLKHGNKIKRQSLNYSIENDQQLFEAITGICDWGFCAKSSDVDSSRPIFIVGMPRSGTTLLERIVSSHSNVYAAGELQDFATSFKRQGNSRSPHVIDTDTLVAGKHIDFTELGKQYLALTHSRSGDKMHFIDKMPLNFLYAGFIHKALPKAKIICLRRHPMDTVLSNFRQLFATHFSYYNYAYDLEDIAQYYILFDKLIAHWSNTLPAHSFCEVQYELLVEDTQVQSQRIIDFLNLDWETSVSGFSSKHITGCYSQRRSGKTTHLQIVDESMETT